MKINLSAPAYRNTIFSKQKLDEITGSIAISLNNEEFKNKHIYLQLVSGKTKKVISQKKLNKLAEITTFQLPVNSLRTGEYILTAKILDKSGKSKYSQSCKIKKVEPSSSGIEWRINKDRILLRNEKPFLPIGWFQLYGRNTEFEQKYLKNVNVAWYYGAPSQSVQQLRKTLDKFHEAGLYVIFYPSHPKRLEEYTKKMLSEDLIKRFQKRVKQLMDHPALLGWYLVSQFTSPVPPL